MHMEPVLRSWLLVMRAVLLELSVRKMPSPKLDRRQRSTNRLIWKVVSPFWRNSFATSSTMQFDRFTVEAALTCPNLSSPSTPVTPDTLTVPEDFTVNASSPMFVQRKFDRLPPL